MLEKNGLLIELSCSKFSAEKRLDAASGSVDSREGGKKTFFFPSFFLYVSLYFRSIRSVSKGAVKSNRLTEEPRSW